MNNNIPFDLQYVPDYIFPTSFCKKADIFPDDVTIHGKLEVSPQIPVNIANLACIVDDYLIQFSANGNMYILEIPTKRLYSRTLADIVDNPYGKDWLVQLVIGSVNMMNGINDGGDSAFRCLMAFDNALCSQTMRNNTLSDGHLAYIQDNVGVSNGKALTLIHGAWDFAGNHVTWGRIAHLLFKRYFANAFDWHN